MVWLGCLRKPATTALPQTMLQTAYSALVHPGKKIKAYGCINAALYRTIIKSEM
ncbi:MAG: hypothetical protein JWR61_4068 [Ferruginibacter sp.]|nr:hypothetical protein [Ferruginibacter sp.]